MIWSSESIQKLLDLYLKEPALWDGKGLLCDKREKELALERIAVQIGMPNLTAEDVNRKYRSMKAAYRVEVRNINTAKVRGFFYKPTLHWFEIFKEHIKKIEEIKMKEFDVPKQIILQGGKKEKNQMVFTINDPRTTGRINTGIPPEVHLLDASGVQLHLEDNVEEESPEEVSSDESEDEFQSFADHIAEQLRMMSVHRAVMIQNKIQRIFANDWELNEEYDEEPEEMMGDMVEA